MRDPHDDSGLFDLGLLSGPRPTFPPRWAEIASPTRGTAEADARWPASLRTTPRALAVLVLTLLASALVYALAPPAPEPLWLDRVDASDPSPAPSLTLATMPRATPFAAPAPVAVAPAARPARAAPPPRRALPAPPAAVATAAPARDWETGVQGTPANLERSIDALLDEAVGDSPADPRPTPPTALPETPTARQVSTTLRALAGEVAQCGEGDVTVRLTVLGATGTVERASVSGAEDAATRACVAEVVQSAHFPRFARERFVITYPYEL